MSLTRRPQREMVCAMPTFRITPMFALGAILVFATVLRVVPLGNQYFWYDEQYTQNAVSMPLSTMFETLISDVHPPLYYVLVKGWAAVLGTGETALRSFSVLFGVLTVALAFVAMRMWHRRSTVPALVAAFVIAINPFLINYSMEARMYSLLAFLLLLATVLLIRSWEHSTVGLRIAYSITLLLIVLTHNFGLIFALVFFAIDAWHAIKTGKMSVPRWLLSGYGIVVLGFGSWFPFFIYQITSRLSLGWVPFAPFTAMATTLHILLLGAPSNVVGVPRPLEYRLSWLSVDVMSLVLVASALLVLFSITRKRLWDMRLLLITSLAFVPILFTWGLQLLGTQLYVERYLIGCSVFIALFFVWALARISPRILIVALVLYSILVLLIDPYSGRNGPPRVTLAEVRSSALVVQLASP